MKKRSLIKTFICCAASVLFIVSVSAAKDLGRTGATYDIAEPDALVEIEEAARRVDWEKAFDKEKAKRALKAFKPEGMKPIPRAKKDRVRLVDMTYTLDHDIPDGKGGVLYPKGFSFNPLDYVSYPGVIVIIDGSDREQVVWFKSSVLAKDHRVALMLSDGSFYDAMQEFGRPVFYALPNVARRLRIEAVPSVVVQKNGMMEVKEVHVKKGDR
jgi:conjugal transfer pilus assembly protein TraW